MGLKATPRDAAIKLGSALEKIAPVSSVGIGQENGAPILIIYVERNLRRSEADQIPAEWMGYAVRKSRLGKITPG